MKRKTWLLALCLALCSAIPAVLWLFPYRHVNLELFRPLWKDQPNTLNGIQYHVALNAVTRHEEPLTIRGPWKFYFSAVAHTSTLHSLVLRKAVFSALHHPDNPPLDLLSQPEAIVPFAPSRNPFKDGVSYENGVLPFQWRRASYIPPGYVEATYCSQRSYRIPCDAGKFITANLQWSVVTDRGATNDYSVLIEFEPVRHNWSGFVFRPRWDKMVKRRMALDEIYK